MHTAIIKKPIKNIFKSADFETEDPSVLPLKWFFKKYKLIIGANDFIPLKFKKVVFVLLPNTGAILS